MMTSKLLSFCLVWMLTLSVAHAGPPYFTDDPVPTDKGHWEIYAFGDGAKTPGQFAGTVGLDLNYGPIKDVQLTATLPVDYDHAGGSHSAAVGDVELGVKYRFWHNDQAGVAVAIFPRVILPTSKGPGKAGLLLPVWAQKDMGPWSLFGGGGYSVNPGAGNRNYWQAGAALTREVSRKVSLGGEIAHRGPDAIGAKSYTVLNFGSIVQLGGPFALLVSGGPGIGHARSGGKYNAYAALSLNF